MIIKLNSKRPCKQEKPSNARKDANFSRGETGGSESSAWKLNCHPEEGREASLQEFGQPMHVTNLKPSLNFIHLSSVSQRCGRGDIELEDVSFSGSGGLEVLDSFRCHRSVQELRGPSARVHDFSPWRCGLKDAWHDSFIDLHSGTLHRFRMKLLQGRCRRGDWRGHGLCRNNVFHERCWHGYTVGAGAM